MNEQMKHRIVVGVARLLARTLAACGVFLLLGSVAAPALAHDNLGGDEMSMAITIFIIGVVSIVGCLLAGIWAWKAGQFSDVERVKYTMLDNADDLDDLPGEPDLIRPVRMQGGSHAAK